MSPVVLYLLVLGSSPPEAPPGYLPPNLYLVRVTTVAVWEEPKAKAKAGPERGRLRVTRVIAGPGRLLDREFEATTAGPLSGGSRIWVPKFEDRWVPLLEKGAEGLWWVSEDPKDQTLRPMLDGGRVHEFCLELFPYQNTKAKPSMFTAPGQRLSKGLKQEELWKEGEEWATAASAVYTARTDDDRRAVLERYAAKESSPIAGWAMALLARGPRDSAVKALRPLAQKTKLEAASQVMLDELLCRLDPKGWNTSADRKALLSRWLDPGADGELFASGCDRVRRAMPDDLDAETFVAVLEGPVARIDRYAKPKDIFVADLLRLSKFRMADAGLGRGFLEQVKQNTKSPDLKAAAVAALRHQPRP